MADKITGGLRSVIDELPVDRLKDELRSGLTGLGERAVASAGERLTGLTDRLNDAADNGGIAGTALRKGAKEAAEGGSPVKGALKGGLTGAKDKIKEKVGGGGSSGDEKGTRSTNIIEEIDVGVPVSVAYNQWTQFQDFSGFMKKVEDVDQEEENRVSFKAQVFWSHRTWEATIVEQVPDDRIVWQSKGEKGRVDGAVTFHELAPNLTRILVDLEYYPQGLFERTGNLWRAQGRRARLELKHFRRHVMNQVMEEAEEIEGWRGEIRDGEVVRSHEEVVEEEQADAEEQPEDEDYEPEDEYADEDEAPEEESEDEEYEEEPEDAEDAEDEEYEEPEDEYAEDEEDEEPEDEYAEDEEDEEYAEDEEEEPEDEAEELEEEPEDEYAEEEYAEEPEEEPEERPRRRRRAS